MLHIVSAQEALQPLSIFFFDFSITAPYTNHDSRTILL
jgi:hypothetical protein